MRLIAQPQMSDAVPSDAVDQSAPSAESVSHPILALSVSYWTLTHQLDLLDVKALSVFLQFSAPSRKMQLYLMKAFAGPAMKHAASVPRVSILCCLVGSNAGVYALMNGTEVAECGG